MKIFRLFLTAVLVFSLSGVSFCAEDDSDDSASSALGGAVLGGLLGAGLGAAIGSASGHAGTGAAIGGGAGALGGTLLAASQGKKKRMQEEAEYREDRAAAPSDVKVKKRIIRQYDEEGNVISEKEVAK